MTERGVGGGGGWRAAPFFLLLSPLGPFPEGSDRPGQRQGRAEALGVGRRRGQLGARRRGRGGREPTRRGAGRDGRPSQWGPRGEPLERGRGRRDLLGSVPSTSRAAGRKRRRRHLPVRGRVGPYVETSAANVLIGDEAAPGGANRLLCLSLPQPTCVFVVRGKYLFVDRAGCQQNDPRLGRIRLNKHCPSSVYLVIGQM